MIITIPMIAGVIATLIGITLVGLYARKGVETSEDFTVGGRSNTAIMVSGTILGSIVGGGSTVGTAQTAYEIGLDGCWQAIGISIGCLILGLFFANHIYKTRVETIPQVLKKTYGAKIGPITSLFGSIAIFFSVISQLKSFIPLLTSVIPMPITYAAVIGVLIGISLILFGGIRGSSLSGLVKMVLIYISMALCGCLAYKWSGGLSGYKAELPSSFLSLFSRGTGNGIARGLSLSLGVIVTQTYIQAILSAKDAKAARNGAFISSVLTLPLGLFGCAIGMYMRINHPDLVSATALPMFFVNYMPDFVAGIFIAVLMITALGSFSGLLLGIATMLSRDIYITIKKDTSEKEMKKITQGFIVITALLVTLFVVTDAGSLIQHFVFLSFGLRTCVFLVPMMFAFFYKGKITEQAGMAAVIVGPLVNIVWNLTGKPYGFDPVFAGLIAALVSFLIVNTIYKNKLDENAL